ncbi:MAG: leucine-rich repeat protein, partial [Clostridium sp.]|nr:leucine-rich repeat protein [Clostridium sp.]
EKLKTVTIEDGMETIPNNLCYNSYITNVEIPESVTKIGDEVFKGCSVLKSVVLPESLKTIGGSAFSGCVKLESVNVPKTVSEIGGYAFSGCSSLTDVVFNENSKTGFTLTIGASAFSGCKEMERLNLTSNVILLGNSAFSGCIGLESVSLPENITVIGDYAFSGCSALVNLTLPSNLERIGYRIIENTKITNILIPNTVTICDTQNYYSSATGQGAPFTGAEKLKTVTIEDGMETIPNNLCYNSYITNVEIPESVKKIGHYAFSGCSKLEKAIIYPWVTEGNIGASAFNGCENLTIYGAADSYAQTYANENNIPFKSIAIEHFTQVGTLTKVDAGNGLIGIDDKEYPVSASLDLSKAEEVFKDYRNKIVICEIHNGEAAKMWAANDVMELKVSITNPYALTAEYKTSTKFIYADRAMSQDCLDIRVKLSYEMTGDCPYTTNDLEGLEELKVTLDRFRLTLDGEGMTLEPHSTLDGRQAVKGSTQNPIEIVPGDPVTYDFSVNISPLYAPSAVKTEAALIGEVMYHGESSYVRTGKDYTVYVHNQDLEQAEREERKKNNQVASNVGSAAAKVKANMVSLVAFEINDYLSAKQEEEMRNILSMWIAEAMVSGDISYSQQSSELRDKLLDKLGVNRKSTLFGASTSMTMKIKANTAKGWKIFRFNVKLSGYGLGTGNVFGSWGSLTYDILDENEKKVEYSGIGGATGVNMGAFTDSVSELLESEGRAAFNLGYGNDANRAAEMIINKSILEVINDKYGSFADGMFTLMIAPVKQYRKEVSVSRSRNTRSAVSAFSVVNKVGAVEEEIPDFSIVSEDGEILAAYQNGVMDDQYGSIFMYEEEGVMHISLGAENCFIEFKGDNAGTVNVTVEEMADDEIRRTISYDVVPLNEGAKLFIPEYNGMQLYDMTTASGESIDPDMDTLLENAESDVRVRGISFGEEPIVTYVGANCAVIPDFKPANATNRRILYTVSDEALATVSLDGTLTGLAEGEVEVTAESADGAYTAVCTVVIQAADMNPDKAEPNEPIQDSQGAGGNTADKIRGEKVANISLSAISKKIAAGRKVTLSAVVLPEQAENKTLIWSSSNPKYATVSPSGVVATKKAGAGKTVTITAKAADESGVTAKYKIKIVKHAVKRISLKVKSKTVAAGKKINVKAVVKTTGKTANKTLVWTSSNPKYAAVNKKGKVTTKKAGKGKTVTITAKATDGTGKKAKVKLKIK